MYHPRLVVSHPTRIAVIGCGYWGMNYVRVLGDLPDSHVAAVCDQRASRLDEVARRFRHVDLTTDVDEALEADGVEAAVICTEAATHRGIAGRALELGKHVLIEKPLTTDLREADELIALAAANDRVLLTGHTFLYNDGVRCMKELVRDGALGEVYYAYARRTNLGPFRKDVNALWDLAPHDVAIFNYLLDDTPTWVSAVGARVLQNGREDVGFICLGYPSGLLGHVHVSWADPHKVREFVVVGSDRRIAFNDLDVVERVRVFDRGVKPDPEDGPTSFGEHHLQIREGDITSPVVSGTEPLKRLSGHFLHCIRRGDRPETPGRDGREIVAVMQAVQQSLAGNGAPVVVERDVPVQMESDLAGPVR
jgi:predicted dehydrogenase